MSFVLLRVEEKRYCKDIYLLLFVIAVAENVFEEEGEKTLNNHPLSCHCS